MNNKFLKASKVPLIIFGALIVISIILFGYSSKYYKKSKIKPIAKDYNELIYQKQDKKHEYVKVTITDIPYEFATESEGLDTYYFVFDEYNYMYVARLDYSTYMMLENEYNEDPENFSYTLYGYILDVPSELKEMAISVYNKNMEDEVLTEENYREYLGNTYLDETENPNENIAIIFFSLFIVTCIFALVVLIIYLIGFVKTKKTLKSFDEQEIEYELLKPTTIQFKLNCGNSIKYTVYLTDKYIVSKSVGLMVLEYKDIVWLYSKKMIVNGIPTLVTLKGLTGKKTYDIAEARIYGGGEDTINEIMSKINEKNPKIMIGYTKENKKEYKLIKKNKKN